MRSVLAILTVVLALGTAGVVAAQAVHSGTVVRIDPRASVITLEDGRMFRVTPGTVLVVDDRPTPLTALQPGQQVVVRSGEVVTLRDGQYVTVSPGPEATTRQPTTVIVQPPGTAVPAGVRQTFHGRVDEVDRDGQVTIQTDEDEFEVKFAPEMLRHIKKGDAVTLDVTITPPGAPSALPR